MKSSPETSHVPLACIERTQMLPGPCPLLLPISWWPRELQGPGSGHSSDSRLLLKPSRMERSWATAMNHPNSAKRRRPEEHEASSDLEAAEGDQFKPRCVRALEEKQGGTHVWRHGAHHHHLFQQCSLQVGKGEWTRRRQLCVPGCFVCSRNVSLNINPGLGLQQGLGNMPISKLGGLKRDTEWAKWWVMEMSLSERRCFSALNAAWYWMEISRCSQENQVQLLIIYQTASNLPSFVYLILCIALPDH